MRPSFRIVCLVSLLLLLALGPRTGSALVTSTLSKFLRSWHAEYRPSSEVELPVKVRRERQGFRWRLAAAAFERTRHDIVYDPSYIKLDYPGGDVAPDRGVCTDVVVRAYRALGIDLQEAVHEDMTGRFGLYPQWYEFDHPDYSIDHRRVSNLMVFFKRHGRVLPISNRGLDYRPGEIIVWDLGGATLHIGIVSDRRNRSHTRPLVVHNCGQGAVCEDFLFYPETRIIGRFEYYGH